MRIKKLVYVTIPKKVKQIIQDEDMKALLAAPPDTQKGSRDRMIMILLYDTAIRIAELLELKISSLKLTSVPSIHIHGKVIRNVPYPLQMGFMRLHPLKNEDELALICGLR